jgi:hypothetical protein
MLVNELNLKKSSFLPNFITIFIFALKHYIKSIGLVILTNLLS